MKLFGKDVKTALMGCFLTDKDNTNSTYHVSVYIDSVTKPISKTVSFYFMDYSTLEQEVYLPALSDSLENFSVNKAMSFYADKRIQKLMDDGILVKPSDYEPFTPDGPSVDGNGIGGLIVVLIVLVCVVSIGVIAFFGFRVYKNKIERRSLESSNHSLMA